MSKIKLFLTILSVIIAVTPLTVQVIIYRDNIVDLVIPPTVADLFEGGASNLYDADFFELAGGMSVALPYLSEDPVLMPDNTIKLTYTFTNPLDGKITITSIDAEIICIDHGFTLGKVFIEPVTLESNQTLNIDVTCNLTTNAIEHITTNHKEQDSINTEFKNFKVELVDITITMDHRKLGNIQIPNQPLLQ
jgi:hypothetical protein